MKKSFFPLVFIAATASIQATESTKVQSSLSELPLALSGPLAAFETKKGWRYGAGLGVELEAEYHGSGETATEADPFIEMSYRSENWEFQSNIFSNKLIYQTNDNLFFSSWLNFEEGREEGDTSDNSLDGMGDIEEMLEVGGGISWQPIEKLTISSFVQGYSGGKPDKGLVGFITAHYRVIDNVNLKLDIGADISFANQDHMQTEFGITDEQAKTSSYNAYSLESGLKSYGLGFNGAYAYNNNVYFTFGADYELYASDVADSPLIKIGSDTEVEASLGFVYKF